MEIIVYAVITVLIVMRLYSVIGRAESLHGNASKLRNKHEENVIEGVIVQSAAGEEAREEKEFEQRCDPAILEMLNKFKKIDTSFTLQNFLKGANIAFEFITRDFFAGNAKELKPLLDGKLYKKISDKINAKKDIRYEFTLVAIKSSDIVDATLQSSNASVTVKFISEQIITTRDDKDTIINENGNKIETVEDIYVFERNLKSSDPNWSITSIDL